MRKSFYIILISVLLSKSSFALDRADVKIIEASENILYLGQKITTDYLLLYQKQNNFILRNKFKENIQELEKNIKNISDSNQKKVTEAILGFYDLRLKAVKESINKEIKKDMVMTLLEISEEVQEGARSIIREHHYEPSIEEKMIVHYKELRYLIESTSKYYMAFQVGIRDIQNDIAMKKVIENINKDLVSITQYNYKQPFKKKLLKINNIWKHNQSFFINIQETSFPNLLLASNTYIKELLVDLENHHKQNL